MGLIKPLFILAASVALLGLSGCIGGDSSIGYVSGTVKVDGQPIEHASVSFKPVQGRGSVGSTDADGNYTLTYVRNQDGALVGQHRVVIRTEIIPEGRGGDSDSILMTKREEMLPGKYCDPKKTELSKLVKAGNNTFDFDLESK